MAKKHLVMLGGTVWFLYDAWNGLPKLKHNPTGYFMDLGGILLVTLIILYLIYLGEK